MPSDPWMKAMMSGDFSAAWLQTDRIEEERRAGRSAPHPGNLRWDGTPLAGKHVLVRCLHGLGDTLQFCRFLPHLAKIASRVTVAIQPPLMPLFPPSSSFGEIVDGWVDTPLPHDVEIEIMELAYAFRVDANSLPAAVPYLDSEWIQLTRKVSLPHSRHSLRIGLACTASAWDPSRSIRSDELTAFSNCNAEWIPLQKGDQFNGALLPADSGGVTNAGVADMARAMIELDLIICVDCMAAHLAGALARPVWVLLKKNADWRWMANRADSPWYPTMRLFRQRVEGSWEEPMGEVLQSLRNETQRANAKSFTSP